MTIEQARCRTEKNEATIIRQGQTICCSLIYFKLMVYETGHHYFEAMDMIIMPS